MLRTYVTNTCKSRYIFPNFLTRFVFFIIFFSFLFRHFTSVDEPTLDLNFYNYSTITFYNYSTIARIFSHTDYIDSYEKYFFKLEALRKDLENIHITLFSKKDLNLPTLYIDLFTYFYTLYIDFCWIQAVVIGLLITKFFFKDSFNVVVYIFCMQLCFSLSILFFWESKFSYHSSLRLCTTKVLFSIRSRK